MIEFLIDLDEKFFLFLNGIHTPWMDSVMFFISGKKEWIPLYLIFVIMIIRQFKWQSIGVFLAIALTILLSDQLTSGIMKPFFARLRPSHSPGLDGLVHIVNGYTAGVFSFASSHAANSFGLATFLWLIFKNQYKWFVWIFLWASIVSYSRVYLGVHYPGDIFVGGLIGSGFGYIGYRVQGYINNKWFIKKV